MGNEPLFPTIVERLRLGTKFRQAADVDALMDEAADEIERLRVEQGRLIRQLADAESRLVMLRAATGVNRRA